METRDLNYENQMLLLEPFGFKCPFQDGLYYHESFPNIRIDLTAISDELIYLIPSIMKQIYYKGVEDGGEAIQTQIKNILNINN